MYTYADIISQLSTEVRDEEAWPSSSNADKLEEQLRLLYASAIAVMTVDSISQFTVITSNNLTTTSNSGEVLEFNLPSNIFKYREDLGLTRASFETLYNVWVQKNINQQQTFETVNDMVSNVYHRNNILFNIRNNERKIIATNVLNAKIQYVALPARPTNIDYTSLNFPINDNDAKRAKHLVASEVSGKTIRDPALSQFHSILSKTY